MLNHKTILAVIPARGGSKSIPMKNIRPLCGKPLLAWTIEEARKSKYIDRLILSTDSDRIAKIGEKYGCEIPFKRPKKLAQDKTPGIAPILHALNLLPPFDYVIMLQPTSPLRSHHDIDHCIEICIQDNRPACISVTHPHHPPYWMYRLDRNLKLKPLLKPKKSYFCRQNLPEVYVINGAVYVAKVAWLKKHQTFIARETIGYPMPTERSIDIDTKLDFMLCESLLTNGRGRKP